MSRCMANPLLPALPVGALVATLAALGCGSSKATSFGEPGSSDSQPPGDGGGAGDSTLPTPAPGSEDGGLTLGPLPEAGATVTSVCKAGVYKGQFMTLVGTGTEGGAPGLFTVMWNGNLTIDLTAKTMVITTGGGNGENFGTDTRLLEIAEGGALEGGDVYGGNFYASLDGQLDCDPDAGPPYHLRATLGNGFYSSAFYNLPIEGSLTADYQASTPPALMNGQILVFSPDAGLLSTTSAGGTWTATWISP
jgi:hypothetical protein